MLSWVPPAPRDGGAHPQLRGECAALDGGGRRSQHGADRWRCGVPGVLQGSRAEAGPASASRTAPS
ncbi:hypothetical protein LT493_44195 [Streptomyces tricolor]|nr:hypothetical protein [Streptomyces tricolor]